MIHFRSRRALGLWVTLFAAGVFAVAHYGIEISLGHPAFFTGTSLFVCLLLLGLLGIRKRLVMLPIGSASFWVQCHIYTGLFALFIYTLHVPRIIANGAFEGTLSFLFLMVSGSGLYGLYASRTAPRRMTAVPGDYRFDRIPWHRQRLADAAADVLRHLDASIASPVLATFYRDQLQPYFTGSVPFAFLAVPNGIRRRRLLASLTELNRYLSNDCRHAAGQLAALVRTRDELDFHYAMQLRLRLWVAIHSILTMILLVWSVVHVLLVLHYL